MMRQTPAALAPTPANPAAAAVSAADAVEQPQPAPEPVLCGHCGRTASNGISCIGACVADSGY